MLGWAISRVPGPWIVRALLWILFIAIIAFVCIKWLYPWGMDWMDENVGNPMVDEGP